MPKAGRGIAAELLEADGRVDVVTQHGFAHIHLASQHCVNRQLAHELTCWQRMAKVT